jgi:linoleoyl-CoA desaturase
LVYADFVDLACRRRHPSSCRSRRREAIGVLVGKAAHVSWAMLLPLALHRWWVVLTFYLVCSWLIGFALAVVFQLAHCNDRVAFTATTAARRGHDFVAHQLATTADFRSDTPVLGPAVAWLVGGLDHQIEHHMAPRLPHTAYGEVARRLRDNCEEHGLPYHMHTGFAAAIASHARWLRAMGRKPPPQPQLASFDAAA